MAKKAAPAATSAKSKKPAAATSREKKLLKDLEARSATVKGGARQRTY